MTTPVLPGRLLRQQFNVLLTVRLMVLAILPPFNPAPARFLNRGLVIPTETIVARFLWKLLLETLIPVPLSSPELLVHPPSAWAKLWWKLVRRAFFLTAPTLPIHENMSLPNEAPQATVILIGTFRPLAMTRTILGTSRLPEWLTQ